MAGFETSEQVSPLHARARRWGIDASDPRWGDGHYYNYGGDCLDTRIYPRAKFVSEFGFQSFPSFLTAKQATAPQDWSYTSPMFNFRRAALPVFLTSCLTLEALRGAFDTRLFLFACVECLKGAPEAEAGTCLCCCCRQRKDNGNPTLFAQVSRQFHVPPAEASAGQSQAALFQQWIYLTQARPLLSLTLP